MLQWHTRSLTVNIRKCNKAKIDFLKKKRIKGNRNWTYQNQKSIYSINLWKLPEHFFTSFQNILNYWPLKGGCPIEQMQSPQLHLDIQGTPRIICIFWTFYQMSHWARFSLSSVLQMYLDAIPGQFWGSWGERKWRQLYYMWKE